MFKSLLTASAIALTTFIGGSAPVVAAPTTCYAESGGEYKSLVCDHHIRVNANGHNVNDVVIYDGSHRIEFSIIWWMTNGVIDYAEVFSDGERAVTEGYIAKNGSWCIRRDDTRICVH